MQRWPSIPFSLYIDDAQLDKTGDKKDLAILAAAARDLYTVATTELTSSVSESKAQVVGSSRAIARHVLHLMPGLPGRVVDIAANLGVDTRAGKARCHGKGSRRVRRMAVIKSRFRKHRALQRAGAKKVARLFRVRVKPQALYGVEVHGATDQELHQYRSSEMALTPPAARTCSLRTKMLLLGDPAGVLGLSGGM